MQTHTCWRAEECKDEWIRATLINTHYLEKRRRVRHTGCKEDRFVLNLQSALTRSDRTHFQIVRIISARVTNDQLARLRSDRAGAFVDHFLSIRCRIESAHMATSALRGMPALLIILDCHTSGLKVKVNKAPKQ